MIIRDSRGKAPNFIIDGYTMIHQPTQITASMKNRSIEEMCRVQLSIKLKLKELGLNYK